MKKFIDKWAKMTVMHIWMVALHQFYVFIPIVLLWWHITKMLVLVLLMDFKDYVRQFPLSPNILFIITPLMDTRSNVPMPWTFNLSHRKFKTKLFIFNQRHIQQSMSNIIFPLQASAVNKENNLKIKLSRYPSHQTMLLLDINSKAAQFLLFIFLLGIIH